MDNSINAAVFSYDVQPCAEKIKDEATLTHTHIVMRPREPTSRHALKKLINVFHAGDQAALAGCEQERRSRPLSRNVVTGSWERIHPVSRVALTVPVSMDVRTL